MKKLITIIFTVNAIFCLLNSVNAQAPQSIPYQAVARDSIGNLIANENISLRFTIRNATAAGTILYRETQNTVTNALGLFVVNIGQGAVITGSFSTIVWASNSARFLQVELDTAGGSNFTNMGAQQMLSVPYALHAGSAAGAWSVTGNGGLTSANFVGTTDNVALNFKVFNQKAGQISSSSSGNTMFGYKSGNVISGSNNTAFGYQTLLLNTNGNRNTSVGYNSLRDNVTGSGNTAVGYQALMISDGGDNTAIGTNALANNTIGAQNTALGVDALKLNTSGLFNIAVGYRALSNNINGQGLTAIGNNALRDMTDGLYNIAIGNSALQSNINGNSNVAIGFAALAANLSSYNTAVGQFTLSSSSTGFGNTSVGTYSMNATTTGELNTAIGGDALKSNVSGSYNVVSGFGAMLFNVSGNENTAIGISALQNNSSGNRNIAIGCNSLFSNDSGSYNIAIGCNANVTSPALTNAVAIGSNALVSSSNSIVLGDNANVGIGTSSPTEKLEVNGKIKTSDFQMTTGAAANTVLTGDAFGNATWQAPVSGADNWGTQTVVTNSKLTGNGTLGNPLGLSSPVLVNSGGTGTTTSFTSGSMVFAGSSGIYNQNNSKLFWDNTNFRLGIGTSSPFTSLHSIGGMFIDNSSAGHANSGNPALTVDGAIGEDIIRARDNGANLKFVIQSSGDVGVNTSNPLSVLDVNGSHGLKIIKPVGQPIDETASVWYFVGSSGITLPTASSCANRVYTIVNRTTLSKSITSFISLSGTTISTMAANTSIEIISDGTNWLQLR